MNQDAFSLHRSLLFTVAYEMLGSAADAEDVVQETWLRWADVDHAEVQDPRAYLVRIVTRQSLNRLRSMARRREDYVGEWLPEPLLTGPDVNVLVYAHHASSVDHERYRTWWEEAVNGPAKFALVDQVLAGLVRVVTHARIFENPMSIQDALAAADAIRSHPNCLMLQSSRRLWEVFRDLCASARAVGNQVPDAYLAAVAITSGSEFITADRGFARYEGLRWRHPLTA